MKLVDALYDYKLIKSKSEGHRLIKQGAVRWSYPGTNDWVKFYENEDIDAVTIIIKAGKRRFLKIEGYWNVIPIDKHTVKIWSKYEQN